MPNINNIPTTQYIGPKIVPHLWNPIIWDATTQYDALAVVQYNGDGYISRYIPPVGTLPTDDEYWVKWADFNAQLANLQLTVDTFDGRIEDVEDTSTAVSNALPVSQFSTQTVKQYVDSINTTLSNSIAAETDARENADISINTSLEQLRDDLEASSLSNECIILLGDSYAQGVHSASATQNGRNWMDMLVNKLGLTDVYKYKGGSAGFVATSTSTSGSSSTVPTGTTYNQILDYAYEYINGLGRADEVKHILIQGGVNDGSWIRDGQTTATAVNNAVGTCITNMRQKFPNAIVHVCYVACGSTEWMQQNSRKFDIPKAYRDSSVYRGATYNQCTNLPWLFSQASYDGSHPTEAMQQHIAGFLGCVLSGNAEDYSGMYSNNGIPSYITPDHALVYMPNINITPSVDWSSTAQPDLCPADDRRVFSGVNFDVPTVFTGSDSIPYIGIFRFYINGRIRWMNRGGYTGNTISSMQFPYVRIPLTFG